jgi:alcohol dehydrogenase class IV
VIADKGIIPLVAVLDPKVLAGLPPAVTAATGMDALTHAVESYLSCWRQPATMPLSLNAVERIFKFLPECVHNGGNLAARQQMLQASFNAGRAFSRASLGYVHGIAHQFGGLYHTPHGVANAMVLPHILEAYAAKATPEILELFTELCFAAGLETRYKMYTESEKRGLMHRFIQGVRDLGKEVGIPENVPQLTREDVKEVVRRAMVESHGEDYPGSPGYPSPTCLDEVEITKIVSALLPPGQAQSKL